MERIKYYYLKIKSAWLSGALLTRVSLFLITSIQTPFEIIFGYIRLPRVDRQLNLKDGFADHRKEKYHHRANPEHIRRIIFSYKAAKEAQEKAAKPFKIKGLASNS